MFAHWGFCTALSNQRVRIATLHGTLNHCPPQVGRKGWVKSALALRWGNLCSNGNILPNLQTLRCLEVNMNRPRRAPAVAAEARVGRPGGYLGARVRCSLREPGEAPGIKHEASSGPLPVHAARGVAHAPRGATRPACTRAAGPCVIRRWRGKEPPNAAAMWRNLDVIKAAVQTAQAAVSEGVKEFSQAAIEGVRDIQASAVRAHVPACAASGGAGATQHRLAPSPGARRASRREASDLLLLIASDWCWCIVADTASSRGGRGGRRTPPRWAHSGRRGTRGRR